MISRSRSATYSSTSRVERAESRPAHNVERTHITGLTKRSRRSSNRSPQLDTRLPESAGPSPIPILSRKSLQSLL